MLRLTVFTAITYSINANRYAQVITSLSRGQDLLTLHSPEPDRCHGSLSLPKS